MAPIRLQKYFTDCGVMSRRAAEEQILLGKVKVNGIIASVGDTVEPGIDKVEFNGKIIIPMTEENICIMLNKPRGYVTTMADERGRKNVSELVKDVKTRVYPIGRLDMDSDGLLLLTNNGALANKLTHPRHEIPKIYRINVKGIPTPEQLKQLGSEMKIDGYKILPVKVEVVSRARTADETSVLQMTLYEGRNRQIRKMCDAVGIKIRRLTRISIGKISLGSLSSGKWRRLTKKEIDYLMNDKEN